MSTQILMQMSCYMKEVLLHTGGVFGLYVALTGERMPGGAVAMAEGNALGKGPVIFHLFDSGIELIRRKAAGQNPLKRAYSTHRHLPQVDKTSDASGVSASSHAAAFA